MKSECSGQPDIPTRSRLSRHARQMGDRADGFLLFGDLSKNKTRPTRKNWASTLLALVGLRDSREPDYRPGSINPPVPWTRGTSDS